MISAGQEIEENGNTQDDNNAKANFLAGKGGGMTEDNSWPISNIGIPQSDCNSNVTMNKLGNNILDSEGLLGLFGGGSKYQTSIFSQDLSYDDLARNIDANLAEIDMEDFRSEDIHSILTLPTMFSGDFQPDKQGEQIASMSGSLLLKFDGLDSASSVEQRSSDSDVSMCRSGPLFSPAKEPAPLPSFSVDSLDCESYDEHELMLTCQANKDNYTITFEGSFTRCSDDSDYHDAGASDDSMNWPTQEKKFIPKLNGSPQSDNSMVQSDYVYTTWSKMKLANDAVRHTGGCDDPISNRIAHVAAQNHVSGTPTSKSQSLPNLLRQSMCNTDMQLSQLNVSGDSDHCVPVFDLQTSHSSSTSSSQHSFSLMRLFIQQKGAAGSLENSIISISNDQVVPTNLSTLPDKRSGSDDNRKLNAKSSRKETVRAREALGDSVQEETTTLEDSLCPSNSRCRNEGDAKKVEDDGDDSDDVEMISVEDKPDPNMSSGKLRWNSRTDGGMMTNFSTCKSNNSLQHLWKENLSPPSSSIGTQTFQNRRDGSPVDALHTQNAKSQSQNRPNSSLVRQHSLPSRKLSVTITTMRSLGTQIPVHVTDQAVQTSLLDDNSTECSQTLHDREPASLPKPAKSVSDEKRSVIVCYPNYSLPDLSFLRSSLSTSLNSARMYLLPQTLKSSASTPTSPSPIAAECEKEHFPFATMSRAREPRPKSCPDIDSLRHRTFHHIRDWDSLNILLPREVRHLIGNDNNGPDPTTDVPRFYRPERGRSGRPSAYRSQDAGTSTADLLHPPPLPKRSISLPDEHGPHCSDDIPRGILRKPSPSRSEFVAGQRFSMCDMRNTQHEMEDRRRSLDEMLNHRLSEPLPCNSAIHLTTKGVQNPNFPSYLPPQVMDNVKAKVHPFPTTKIDLVEPRPDMGSAKISSSQDTSPEQDSINICCEHSCCMCERHRGKKTVSFSEKVCIRESFTPEGSQSPAGSPLLHGMHYAHPVTKVGEPHHSSGVHRTGQNANTGKSPANMVEDGDMESPPNEFCISPLGSNSPCGSPRTMDQPRSPLKEVISQKEGGSIADLTQKKALVLAVSGAVDVLLSHFGQARDPQEKYQLGNSSLTPSCGQKVLKWLCPALHAFLSDGLQPQIYSLFGHINNSVWAVVEASVQSSPTTRALNDLIVRLNAEEELKENLTKFNAFIFGLLNIRSLDSWLAYLRSRETLVMKHYQPHSFLSLANAGGRHIFDDLLLALQPLSTLPFEMDLLFEVFNKNMPFIPKWGDGAGSPTKRVQVPNCKVSDLLQQQHHHIENFQSHILGKETKEMQNQQARQSRYPETEAYNSKSSKHSVRPKSYSEDSCNNAVAIDPTQRRWSGVQIGPHLLNAFDRRSVDNTWVDIPSGLDNTSLLCDRSDDRYLLLNRPKPDGAADSAQGTPSCFNHSNHIAIAAKPLDPQTLSVLQQRLNVEQMDLETNEHVGGHQFKELQEKWEKLSAKPERPSSNKTTPVVTPESESNSVTNGSLPLNRSRIPRLVTPNRQSKMEDSAISLRSSASGQSTHSPDAAKVALSKHDIPAAAALISPPSPSKSVIPSSLDHRTHVENASPVKRPAPSRTLSAPAATRRPSSKSSKNQDSKRITSPPRAKSGLPRKAGNRNSDGADYNSGNTNIRRK